MNQEPTEIFDLGALFEAVQIGAVLEDGKTFVDCIPLFDLKSIQEKYESTKINPILI